MLDLSYLKLTNLESVYHNLATPALVEEAVRRREGHLSHLGPLVTRTGQYTGRSANDKFVVKSAGSEAKVWWGKHNKPYEPAQFDGLLRRLQAYLQGRTVFVQDAYSGADPEFRIRVRVVTETAWHNVFVRNMFIRELDQAVLDTWQADFTVLHCPNFHAIPEIDHTNSEAFVLVDFDRKTVIIGGTSYAGEIKKSIFTVMNYLLPQRGVLSMHCSANQGRDGDVALFFGLSGTGKTTLSSEPDRALIGDDEHGWSDNGVFNLEGGCYAKVIRLDEHAEPEIFETTRRFGTILENVAMDMKTRHCDLADATLAENTRASYPLTHLPNVVKSGRGGHPRNVVMLTADAFGVMPPVSKLSPDQAMYHFLSGYTARIAGTERGVTEPAATFSACFGAPFMALNPTVYAELLGKKLAEHKSACWLINTGWTGGPYGTGHRISIKHTRAMIRAAFSGALDKAGYDPDPVFGVMVPRSCPDVPNEVLRPRDTWPDKAAYDAQAKQVAKLFGENFTAYSAFASDSVKAAAPKA
ncbi:MAG: phosphoenolpyruvate carboxykinase (ATP) [bacterium]|nr:phosphoenolpyruvate carboxykinase (ATP) [bacterium]MBK9471703.1 phosphoenolpyruvate carboxykinase (ATP) [bacterium]